MKEAEYLLTERTAMAPNDAQAWRRLASLYGRTGERAQVDLLHATHHYLLSCSPFTCGNNLHVAL